jgi:hypothetical protein
LKPDRLIAHVRCADPPNGLTLAQWLIWRADEDKRMRRELAEQRDAFYELLTGAVVH